MILHGGLKRPPCLAEVKKPAQTTSPWLGLTLEIVITRNAKKMKLEIGRCSVKHNIDKKQKSDLNSRRFLLATCSSLKGPVSGRF